MGGFKLHTSAISVECVPEMRSLGIDFAQEDEGGGRLRARRRRFQRTREGCGEEPHNGGSDEGWKGRREEGKRGRGSDGERV